MTPPENPRIDRRITPVPIRIWIPIAGLCLFVAACAPRDAGFGSVQVMLEQRAGIEANWDNLRSDPDKEMAIANLLGQPVGAEQAVEIALRNNTELQAAYEELGIAEARVLQSSLPPNIDVEGHVGYVDAVDRTEFDVAALIDISDLILLPLRRGAASAELEAVRFGAAGRTLELIHMVRRTFYTYQATEQLLELARTVLEASDASYAMALRLYEAGNITSLEQARQQAFFEEARLEVVAAEGTALAWREELNVLMGLSGSEAAWTLYGRLADPTDPPPDVETIETLALDQSLDLLELDRRYIAAARRARVARVEGLFPSLRAGVHVGREIDLREAGPVVGFEIPIFDRGQAVVAAARAEMRQLEHRYAAGEVRIRSAVRSAWNQTRIAGERVRHYRETLLPLRQQIVDGTQRDYNAMQASAFELITARKEEVQTGRRYVIALRDYWQARTALDSILAGRLVPVPDGLGSRLEGPSARDREAPSAAND